MRLGQHAALAQSDLGSCVLRRVGSSPISRTL